MFPALVLGLILTAAPVASRPAPHYRLVLDLPVTLVAAGAWSGLDLAAPALADTSCPCDRARLPAFDRFAVDARWSAGNPAAQVALTAALLGSALALVDAAPDAHAAGEDVGLAAEAAMLAGLATEVTKIAISRPYPFMYRPEITADQQRSGINYASMGSGHAAVAMAASVAAARLLDLRSAPRALRIAVWIAGPALAVAAGALELSAGNHFPSDVLVGASMGAALGWGVVALHTP